MSQKRIQFTIDNKGNWGMKTLEGFSGESCVEQTRNLEVAIGGSLSAEGKTSAYYDADGGDASVTISN